MDDKLREAHRQASDWLILLHEEPDNEPARQRFELWLDSDPDHARAWVSVSYIFKTIGETQPEMEAHWRPVSNDRKPIRARHVRGRRWLRRSVTSIRRPVLAGAAAAALAAFWLAPSAMLHLRSDHITGSGEVSAVRLADGSAVRLGPNSAIALDFNNGERTIRLLAGQAWFDVKHDPSAPFRVVAGNVRTTVLGTSFDVRRIGETIDVSVRQGRVRVVDHGVAPATTQELSPGQWVRVGIDHEVESGSGNPALLGAWQRGSIVIHNRRIADVIDEIRPWYNGRIVLLTPALGHQRVDGVFDAHDPGRAITALVQQAGGTVRKITPWIIVIS